MSDARLRDLERLARAGDAAARVRWRAAMLRLRDPRLNPAPGDVVQAGVYVTVHRVHGKWVTRARLVTQAPDHEDVVRWQRVRWLYGEEAADPGSSGLCYDPRVKVCKLATWRRWARNGSTVRLGEERSFAQEEIPRDPR